jgi:USP8 dimerisation domain
MSSQPIHSQGSINRTPRPSRRPASIEELAERAKDDHYDGRRDLKYHLRNADKFRRTAKELVKAGDLEAAFVEFAKAATLVLEKLPYHRDYHSVLTAEQRHNLALVRFIPLFLVLSAPEFVWQKRPNFALMHQSLLNVEILIPALRIRSYISFICGV